MMQILGIEVIILHSIGRFKEYSVLQTFDGMDGVHLNLQRERGREALQIVLGRVYTFRFQKELVGVLPRKRPQLIFNAGTVTRALAMNESGEKRRTVKTGAKDIVYSLIRMKKIAVHLHSPTLDR